MECGGLGERLDCDNVLTKHAIAFALTSSCVGDGAIVLHCTAIAIDDYNVRAMPCNYALDLINIPWHRLQTKRHV